MANVIEQIVQPKNFGTQTIEMTVRSNERGPQGPKGDTGEAANVDAGSAYTIEYGKQPIVMNSGTPGNAVFDFYIPEGKPGAIHYYAGPGINITADNRIEATGEMAVYWGDLVGSINNQTDLKNILSKTVVESIYSISSTASSVIITPRTVDLFSGSHPAMLGIPIPVASSTKAGVITASKYDEIGTNTTNIATKLGYSNLTVDSTLDKTVTGTGTDTAIALGIKNSGVDTTQIADSAVTTAKINDGAVSASKLDKTTVLNLFYPVGSYYETSDTDFNPNTSWGGTWVEDSAGRVTVAKDTGTFSTVGSTGGEETHTLTVSEMPSHTHNFEYGTNTAGTGQRATVAANDGPYLSSGVNKDTGGDQAHNNLQPYVVVRRWHRTA